MKKLFVEDIKASNLFKLVKLEYLPSVDLSTLDSTKAKYIEDIVKKLNYGAIKVSEFENVQNYIKQVENYSIDNVAVYHGNDEYSRFKLIRDFIFKHQTFFYDTQSVIISNDSYGLVMFDYINHAQYQLKKVNNLLSFLLFDKDAFPVFGDDSFKEKIKPLIQEALQNPYYHQELHKNLFMALNNTKLTQFLLDCGLDPNYKNKDGLTPLMISSNTGVIKALLHAGAKIDTTNELDLNHSKILGISCNSKRFKALIHKNAYEMHSILANNAVLKVFDTQEKIANVVGELAYSEHFQKEYQELKSKGNIEKLIKASKNNNSVILDNLAEFKPLFFQNHRNFVLHCVSENKAEWLEKALSLFDKKELLTQTRDHSINMYLEMCTYYKAWNSLESLFKLDFYEKDNFNFDHLISRIYDAKAMELCYEKLPGKVNFQHLLQSTNVELIEKAMKDGLTCDDSTFHLFCEGIKGNMRQYFGREQLHMASVKSNIVDCLCIVIKNEPNENIKEARLNQFIEALSHFEFHSEIVNKSMKSKIQKALKYFPEKRDIILGNIAPNFPELVSHYEKRSFNQTIKKLSTKKKEKIISEEHVQNEVEVIKPKRNKI